MIVCRLMFCEHVSVSGMTVGSGQAEIARLTLIPDPVNQTLGPRPESPDRPLLRVSRRADPVTRSRLAE